ncbi:HAAS signaling domain-containing protein [Neobacillus sp. Marseille-QA0830]
MNLIDLYIREVTRRLPEKSRSDIALELRSTIEDMLPENYKDSDVREVLKKLGDPSVLARGYLDQPMYLIGPKFYDPYINMLKIILPIAVTVTLLSFFIETLVNTPENHAFINIFLTGVISDGIVRVLMTIMQTFFWLTLVFAVMERVDLKNHKLLGPLHKEWNPDDLTKISVLPREKAIPRIEIYGPLIWTAIWVTFYFKTSSFAGVYQNGQGGHIMVIIPSLNQEVLNSYWLLVVLTVILEISLALYKWRIKQWTKKLAATNTIVQIMTSLIFVKIITAPKLFTGSFDNILANLFPDIDNPTSWFIRVTIAIFVIFAAIDAYQSFRKASMPSSNPNNISKNTKT